MPASPSPDQWPALSLDDWRDTYATLHMWTQIVGKIRLALAPPVNHWWHVPLYVSARGITTSPMPHGRREMEITFDFIDHELIIACSDGTTQKLGLHPQSVADFYVHLMSTLDAMGLPVRIWPVPVEVADPVPFQEDRQHASYDAQAVHRFWRVLVQADRVFKSFRGRFLGKCSPVHFYWGSFDLAVTRFSGRPAPPREGADAIMREAYSHEVISHGFWPGGTWIGGVEINHPIFYSYTVPEPPGLRGRPVQPPQARFDDQLQEFVLSYEDVRRSPDPAATLMQFLQSTYDAGADAAGWDRAGLDRAADGA